MAHTPGPWKVAGPVGAAIWITDATANNQIAMVYGAEQTPDGYANAHLIAASTELLASLKDTVEIVADELENIIECHTLKGDRSTLDEAARPDVERFERVLAEARAIIAKAEGRA